MSVSISQNNTRDTLSFCQEVFLIKEDLITKKNQNNIDKDQCQLLHSIAYVLV